jgi:hypothetical protein
MNRRFLVSALCVLAPLTCPAQNVNGEATYVSFSAPGALGTYPMSINNSMAVTGYYYVSPTQTSGFVRTADGSMTTFSVRDGVWTEPESINDAGDITGFYEVVAGVPHNFIRYADGQIITFDPPCVALGPCNVSVPVSINDFGEIAGNYPFLAASASARFSRSRAGVFTTIRSDLGAAYGTVATAMNASGAVVGYWNNVGEEVGFLAHSDGFWAQISAPLAKNQIRCISDTAPESINAGGTIAGWYLGYTNNCNTKITGGFVLSTNADFTLFQPPGTLLMPLLVDFAVGGGSLTASHQMSIDQAGDIVGSYTDTAGAQHGFIRNPYGTITSFDPPRGRQTTATSINDSGAITGFYHYYYHYSAGAGPPMGFIREP